MEKHSETIREIIELSLRGNIKALGLVDLLPYCELLARCMHLGLVNAGYDIYPALEPEKQVNLSK